MHSQEKQKDDVKNHNNIEEDRRRYRRRVGMNIYHQIDGARFQAMTGATFVTATSDDRPCLNVTLPEEAKDQIRKILITYQANDLYQVEFLAFEGRFQSDLETVEKFNDIYADQLKSLIRETTGLAVSL